MKKDILDPNGCPVTATMGVIGGKWKILIVHLINNDVRRFGKMGMILKECSRQMLTTQLRDLEADGIINRKIYAEIPPRVEYSLTEKGQALIPVLNAMRDFGFAYELDGVKEKEEAVTA